MKKMILLPVLALLLLTFSVLINTNTAYAATGEVADRSTIRVGEQVFFDGDMDDNFSYEEQNPTDSCPDRINGFNNSDFHPNNTPAQATLVIRTPGAAGTNTGCTETTDIVFFMSSRVNFLRAFVWIDPNTIGASDGKLTFERDGTSGTFVSTKNSSGCRDTLTLDSNNQFLSLVERVGGNSSTQPNNDHDYDWYPFRPGSRTWNESTNCWEAPVINNIHISGTPEEGNNGGAQSAGGSSGRGEDDNSCSSNSGALGWIMCPIAGILDSTVGFLDDQIRQMLILKDDYFKDVNEEGENDLKAAWASIRNIAYVILVPIMLVMVIGTALGFEIFSAYTIKKALPRMVMAIIFITLSWYICLFLVDFFNVVGSGIRGLITGPFDIPSGSSPLKTALDEGGITRSGSNWAQSGLSGAAVGGIGIAGITAAWAVGAASLGILMSTLATAALVLGGIFLLLIARQMILIALFLIAPLAILSWIFPGNDKLWKLWWGGFTKLLMLFPLIMLLIGVGEVFANVTADARGNAGDNQLITVIIIIGAFIMPFFFIPFAFKWAGGVFGNLAGMVNDRERGVLDRLRKGRTEKRTEGWGKFKSGTGTGFAQKNAFTRRVGMGVGAGAMGGKGFFGYGEKGKARMDQMNRQNAVDQIMKNPAWNGVNQDDNALHAGILLQDFGKDEATKRLAQQLGANDASATATERAERQAEAERAITAWGASGLGGRAAAIAAAQQLVSTGTGFKGTHLDENGNQLSDIEFMTRTLARASGGNASTRTAMAGFANSEAKKTGNHHLAPGFGTVKELADSWDNGGYGASSASASQWSNARTAAWQSGSLYEHANDKPDNLKAHIAHFEQELASGDYSEGGRVESAAKFFEELKSAQPNAKGANAELINQALSQNGSTLQQEIDKLSPTTLSADTAKNVYDPSATETDPLTGEVKRKVVAQRAETARERISRQSRGWERPDPNRM